MEDKKTMCGCPPSFARSQKAGTGILDIYIFLAVFSLALIIVIAASEELGTQLARLVNPLSKSNPITVSYVKNVVKIIGAPDSVYKDYFKDGSDESVVSREEFDEI